MAVERAESSAERMAILEDPEHSWRTLKRFKAEGDSITHDKDGTDGMTGWNGFLRI
jgi:hypothetical protein